MTNAKVVTMNQQHPRATAFAVTNGNFVAVGDAADVAPYRGAKTRIIDARGHAVIHGLADSHSHVIRQGRLYNRELRSLSGRGSNLNNVIEQEHRFVKKKVRAPQCFESFHTAERTLGGSEVVNMMRKCQVKRLAGSDTQGQAKFVESLFGLAA